MFQTLNMVLLFNKDTFSVQIEMEIINHRLGKKKNIYVCFRFQPQKK